MRKNLKRIISLVAVLALSFSIIGSANGEVATATKGETEAKILNQLKLFKGTDDGFELDRAPTRIETIIMLIRMTGKETDIYMKDFVHPFTDVPTWENAEKYIGYAYENKLTAGVSETQFGSDDIATTQMYVTFMLRALGYKDVSETETVWNNWEKLGKEAGILTEEVAVDDFKRGDAVLISHNALDSKLVGEEKTLIEKLKEEKVFSDIDYSIASVLSGKEVTSNSELMDIIGKIYANTDSSAISFAPMEITKENLSSYFGVETLDFKRGLAVEPMMGSFAHSVCLIEVNEGVDVEQVKKDIKEKVNPRKWICVGVEPENVRVENIGNLILLVMDNIEPDKLVNNFLSLK